MSNIVENGFKVINIDNSELEKLKRSSNTLDCGATKILESLDLFCEDLVDSCEYSSQISYQSLFNSLRTVIRSAYENEKIRNAVMTGIIQDTHEKTNEMKEDAEIRVTNGVRDKDLDLQEVTKYCKEHTLLEAARYFGISKKQMHNYCYWHKISFVVERHGRKSSIDKEKLLEVSADMTIRELAALFNVKICTMQKFCERNNVPYKSVKKEKNNV